MKTATQPALNYETFLMRDCSRSTNGWFCEIWGRGEQAEPLYRSGYHDTIEDARAEGDRWLAREAERRTKARE
jgi:hypothetical protein